MTCPQLTKSIFKISPLLLLVMGIFLLPRFEQELLAQANLGGNDVGVTISPSIELEVSGGINQFGKKTIFSGTTIDFGVITFTHPELISNGDAYLKDGKLILEAVTDVRVVFSGASSVALDLKRLKLSTNPFHKTYYSLSLNRSAVPEVIFDDPRSSRLTNLTQIKTTSVRLLFEMTPQQSGRITDRIRLEAQAI